MPKISASILSADFSILKEEVQNLEMAGANMIHIDVMDGVFVPNLTIGPKIVKDLRKHTTLPIDVHLMVQDPENYIEQFVEAGSDLITIHFEATSEPRMILHKIRSLGLKAGLSIKPETKSDVLREFYQYIDLVLVMTVEPGFGGQRFMDAQLEKIKQIHTDIGNQQVLISVDGGITHETAKLAALAGADILVAGSAIFKDQNYKENIMDLS